MNIQAFMMSCPEREAVRNQTLANLARTDWQSEVTVVLDESTDPDRVRRIAANGHRLIHLALARPEWDYMLFLEDDLDFNRHLHHNLLHWRPLREGAVGLASLYNPSLAGVFEMAPFHYRVVSSEVVYGSQAFLVGRECLTHIADHFGEVPGMPDVQMPRLAERLAPIYYHWPSLVQHVGQRSVWGGRFHLAGDFDATFRSEAPQPIYT